MNRITLIFGGILGLLLCINLFYMVHMCYSTEDMNSNDVLGYAVMVVIFSMTFFGILNYRNKYLGGFISFGKAFKTGALIALAGATMYVAVWLFYYYLFVPDFLDKYIPHAMKEASRKGASFAELADTARQMETLRKLYKNPLFIILITYSEVLPVGFIVALISSFILKRKPGTETNYPKHNEH